MKDPKSHWRYRHPILHRLERWLFFSWEYVTWGPLYFVRRAICRVVGHDDDFDTSDVPFGSVGGTWFCRRCMEHD